MASDVINTSQLDIRARTKALPLPPSVSTWSHHHQQVPINSSASAVETMMKQLVSSAVLAQMVVPIPTAQLLVHSTRTARSGTMLAQMAMAASLAASATTMTPIAEDDTKESNLISSTPNLPTVSISAAPTLTSLSAAMFSGLTPQTLAQKSQADFDERESQLRYAMLPMPPVHRLYVG